MESFQAQLKTLKNDNKKSRSFLEKELPKLKSPNKQFPAFSSAVEVKYEAGRGRFGVATRDVRLGEMICVETPPVAFLHSSSSLSCSLCFTHCPAPLPSPYTTEVVFCSR